MVDSESDSRVHEESVKVNGDGVRVGNPGHVMVNKLMLSFPYCVSYNRDCIHRTNVSVGHIPNAFLFCKAYSSSLAGFFVFFVCKL